jgi:hypothetical protein
MKEMSDVYYYIEASCYESIGGAMKIQANTSTITLLPVIKSRGKHNQDHLLRIEQTLDKALEDHPRTLAIRVDLRMPALSECYLEQDSPTQFINSKEKIISRFFASLKAKIDHDQKKRKKAGTRVHKCTLRYIWARERSRNHNEHYHVFLFLNKDTYRFIGGYKNSGSALENMIRKAWNSALGIEEDSRNGLVHFPENPFYHLNTNDPDSHSKEYRKIYYRASYLAKVDSKDRSDGRRCFGCSQK